MNRILFLLFLWTASAVAQDGNRFFIRVNDQDNDRLVALIEGGAGGGINGVTIVRNLWNPRQILNALSVLAAGPDEFDTLRAALSNNYPDDGFILIEEPQFRPLEGTGDTLGLPEPPPPTRNPALDLFVPDRPIKDPPAGHLTGRIIVDIIGTGVDQLHPDLAGLSFEPWISPMPAMTGGRLPGDVDYHNHETRIAGIIGGIHTGLLTALGTRDQTSYRSVLCYPKPIMAGPGVPFTYTSDCIAALTELIAEHEARLSEPYLRNHGAVMNFSHAVETFNTRVGDLDSIFDLAWERGIFTSIAAGNTHDTAAASSPAGAGEWIVFDNGMDIVPMQYWPPIGAPSFMLPGTFGFETVSAGGDYHFKTGAHTGGTSPILWSAGGGLGTGINTPNPAGYGPPMNQGVDVFAPGFEVEVAGTSLMDVPMGTPGSVVVDGMPYLMIRGYQKGTGTSYSTAFTTALATRILQLRPWASPGQVRAAIIAAIPASTSFEVLTIPNLDSLDPMALTYAEWIQRYRDIAPFSFFSGGLDGKLADPDGDGVVNFVEYHCGMDPRHRDSRFGPKVTFDSEARTLKVEMQVACYLPNPADIDWSFEASTDLADWDRIGKGVVTDLGFTSSNGDGVEISALLDFRDIEPKEFYRVSVFDGP